MKPKTALRSFLLGSLVFSASPVLHAFDYYWDNDVAAGFGSAGGTWTVPTVGQWNTDPTGTSAAEASVTTATTDSVHFGDGATGLGAGTITVSGTVDSGNLTFASGSGDVILSGGTINLAAASTITADNAANTISSILAGPGTSLTKAGTGALILTAANTYGNTIISAGILQIGAGTTGTLGSGTVLNDSALVFNRSTQINVLNLISGSGTVTQNGAAVLEIQGNNTYNGGTFINSGILLLRTDTGARLGSGAVNVASGGSYLIWAPSAVTLTNNIVLNGPTGNVNRPALNHDGGNGKVTLTGTVTLNATSDIGIGGGSGNDMEITGVVSGVGGMIVDEKNQGGTNRTLTLSGANTYTGPTSVTAGTLKAGVASVANVSGAFGKNSAVTLSNSANVNLDITGFATQIGSLTGGGASGGNVILGAAVLSVGGDNTSPAAYAGIISGSGGVTKIGSGTQILSGVNTYTGLTSVSAGTLTLSGNRTANTTGGYTVTGAGTQTLNIQSGNYGIGGTFTVGANSGTATVNHSAGIIKSVGANGLIMGNGTSTSVYNLSGGALTITTNGIIMGTNSGTSPANPSVSTINVSGTGALTASTLRIGRYDTAGTISTTNTFNQTAGTTTVTTLGLGGNNTNSGNSAGPIIATLDLTGGTFTATTIAAISVGGAVDVANANSSFINIGGSAQVTLGAFPTVRGTNSTATITFDSTTGFLSPGVVSASYMPAGTFTNAYLTANGAKFNVVNNITIGQVLKDAISQTGTLTKSGAGTLTLSGINTYTGGTTVSGGTLALGASDSITTSASVAIAAGATLNTSLQASYAIPAAQPVTFGIDGAGSGSSGKIAAADLNISNATVTYDIAGPLDDAVYVLATYTGTPLTGPFLSVPAPPSGYTLDYAYEGNKIALVQTGGTENYLSWATANGVTGGENGDHDNDGVKNLVEYALIDGGERGVYSGNTITYTKRPAPYGTDLSYAIEISTDLGIADPWETAISGVTEDSTKIQYTFTPSTPVRNFARLKVVKTTP